MRSVAQRRLLRSPVCGPHCTVCATVASRFCETTSDLRTNAGSLAAFIDLRLCTSQKRNWIRGRVHRHDASAHRVAGALWGHLYAASQDRRPQMPTCEPSACCLHGDAVGIHIGVSLGTYPDTKSSAVPAALCPAVSNATAHPVAFNRVPCVCLLLCSNTVTPPTQAVNPVLMSAVNALFRFPPLFNLATKKARQTIRQRAIDLGMDWDGAMAELQAQVRRQATQGCSNPAAKHGRNSACTLVSDCAVCVSRPQDWAANMRDVVNPSVTYPSYYTQPFHAYTEVRTLHKHCTPTHPCLGCSLLAYA